MSDLILTKDLSHHIQSIALDALASLGVKLDALRLESPPNPDMGDLGFPCFPFARTLRKNPALIANDVRDAIQARLDNPPQHLTLAAPLLREVSTQGPYVNLRLDQPAILSIILQELHAHPDSFGRLLSKEQSATQRPTMIEFSSPNTNKPQHLGHVRNNLLGQTLANILSYAGYPVLTANLINDRGVHICKSMHAYATYGQGETPQSSGIKGDHLIGKYYVLFNQKLDEEYKEWAQTDSAQHAFTHWLSLEKTQGMLNARTKDKGELSEKQKFEIFIEEYKNDWYNTTSTLGLKTRELLRKWEAGDNDVRTLWAKLNGWVEEGFHATYKRMGVHFDRIDHESETYLLGKDIVQQGFQDGVFHKADNGAIVFDLTPMKLEGEKALLRPDGTSLYTTQDLGTALRRFDSHNLDSLIYVVGNEQELHFRILFEILANIRPTTKDRCYHLSYGMISLPGGVIKSSKGKVVTADDLMDGMHELAREGILARIDDPSSLSPDDLQDIHTRSEHIGLAGLKYFMLNYSARTNFTFFPDKSIDPQGQTGVYSLYAYARTSSILRRCNHPWNSNPPPFKPQDLHTLSTPIELGIIKALQNFPMHLDWAINQKDPSKLTKYAHELSSSIASFFNDSNHKVIESEGPLLSARLQLIYAAGRVLYNTLRILGIEPLERV